MNDNKPCTDPVIEANVAQLRQRSIVGVGKYGFTLADNPLSLYEWLEHTKQEMMDAINYITRVQMEIKESSQNT